MRKTKSRSLRAKIMITIVSVVIAMLLCVSVIFLINTEGIANTLIDSNEEMSQTSNRMSSASMAELTQIRLRELADDKADIADHMFLEFEQAVCVVASAAERAYAGADSYPERDVAPPEIENDGKLTLQVLYASDTDPNDEQIIREVRLLGNIQDTLFAVNSNFESMASVYVATETGIMVQADYIAAKKFDEAGNIMPLDAKERPWYQGAADTGAPYLTPVTQDLHTPRMAIMCGVPIYRDSALMGVAGAGMYLDDIETLVQSVNLGENGDACIVNQFGQVLFSTYGEGALAASADKTDLRAAGDRELAELVKRAVDGESGVELLEIDGVMRYAAYAPMKTVGWSIFIILSQEEVETPTQQLQAGLNQISDQAILDARKSIKNSNASLIALLPIAIIAAVLISLALSQRIVEPIRKLTDEVSSIDGEKLDFNWDLDTGDETQLLAKSFQSLTGRMKTYIEEIQNITAETERIETELSLAARIQAAMLPSNFPPFPNRSEFDLYATMDPARAVGGDFYDFYLIDEDHLCLVIADVSGKGVPAALFMMVSKIILQSCAMLGKGAAEILTKTNEAICSNNSEGMFVTVWVGILEISTGKLTAANAGHEYPVLKRPDGGFELMKDKHGLAIGAMDDTQFHEYELQLEPGTKIFVYTDGVPEASDAQNNMFGTQRLLDTLNGTADAAPEQILKGVQSAVDDFVNQAEQFDDLTMLCMEYRGGGKKTD